MYWHASACITMYYIAVHELGDHISEKASTSCIFIRAAMTCKHPQRLLYSQ